MILLGAVARAENADVPETKIILEMQTALRSDDRQWFAEHLHLPVRYYGKTKQTIRSKNWFLQHYGAVIGPELKAAILAQDPQNYLGNYQGIKGSKPFEFTTF